MTASLTDSDLARRFAPEHDAPLMYIPRIHEYYATFGYKPYRWAQYTEVPFTPLGKPLAESTVALVTTAAPHQPDKGDQGPGAAYNASAKFYEVYTDSTQRDPDLRISHVGYDRKHTTATDSNSWFPLKALRRAVKTGRIGALTPRFYGAPTNRSHRVTLEQDAAQIVALVKEDRADVAILVGV